MLHYLYIILPSFVSSFLIASWEITCANAWSNALFISQCVERRSNWDIISSMLPNSGLYDSMSALEQLIRNDALFNYIDGWTYDCIIYSSTQWRKLILILSVSIHSLGIQILRYSRAPTVYPSSEAAKSRTWLNSTVFDNIINWVEKAYERVSELYAVIQQR